MASVHRLADTVGDVVTEFRLTIVHGVTAASARRAVEQVLDDWNLCDHVDDVLLVTTERIHNIIRHTAGVGELRMALLDDVILVEATDTDPRPPVLREQDHRGLNGRGLIIIAAVARRWGHRPVSWAQQPGKVVWAEVELQPAG